MTIDYKYSLPTHTYNVCYKDNPMTTWQVMQGVLPESELAEHVNEGFLFGRKKQDKASTYEVSPLYVAPCVSAVPPFGWRPFHSDCIYMASHLYHTEYNVKNLNISVVFSSIKHLYLGLPVWMRICLTSWLGFLNVFPQWWQTFLNPLRSMFL